MTFSFRDFLVEDDVNISVRERYNHLIKRLKRRDTSHKDEIISLDHYAINVCSIPPCALLPQERLVYLPIKLLYDKHFSLGNPYYGSYGDRIVHLPYRSQDILRELKDLSMDEAYSVIMRTVDDVKKEVTRQLAFYQVCFFLRLRHVEEWTNLSKLLPLFDCAKLARLDYHEWVKLLARTKWKVFSPAQLDQLRLASLSDDPDQIGMPDDV